jgi:hypothetical protein
MFLSSTLQVTALLFYYLIYLPSSVPVFLSIYLSVFLPFPCLPPNVCPSTSLTASLSLSLSINSLVYSLPFYLSTFCILVYLPICLPGYFLPIYCICLLLQLFHDCQFECCVMFWCYFRYRKKHYTKVLYLSSTVVCLLHTSVCHTLSRFLLAPYFNLYIFFVKGQPHAMNILLILV